MLRIAPLGSLGNVALWGAARAEHDPVPRCQPRQSHGDSFESRLISGFFAGTGAALSNFTSYGMTRKGGALRGSLPTVAPIIAEALGAAGRPSPPDGTPKRPCQRPWRLSGPPQAHAVLALMRGATRKALADNHEADHQAARGRRWTPSPKSAGGTISRRTSS